MKRIGIAATALIGAGPAAAHSFDTGADAYNQVVEGTGVVLTDPGLLIPILALGILLSLWDAEGLPRAWPFYLLGQIAGVIVASVVGPWITTVFIALGIVIAALAALLPRPTKTLAIGLAALTGVGALAVGLEGHGLFELSVFIHLGLILGVNIAVALPAGAARVALDKVAAPWMRIGWRVAASWLGAILVLYLAFEMTGGLS
ncbi:hypothetical protein KUV65_09720 [Maritalea mobilis]|uniref:hypothetical protein n=1 Tax=Maritalea mobilis TaxID=483324 RepID=UPI001C965650|nr:hypothetical protein [Maritalea mobilis]MBY6201639.1 hypothetical protein [Maritalea mobilis]